MDDPKRDAIRRLIEPLLAEEGAELVELTLKRGSGQTHVCLLIDQAGGVTVQRCARVSQLIGQALETSNLIEERYTLEVSSPGLDRPLVSRRDFERAIGEQLDVQLGHEAPGSKQLEGMLLSVQDDAIVLTTRSGNVNIPFGHIQRARKALPF